MKIYLLTYSPSQEDCAAGEVSQDDVLLSGTPFHKLIDACEAARREDEENWKEGFEGSGDGSVPDYPGMRWKNAGNSWEADANHCDGKYLIRETEVI